MKGGRNEKVRKGSRIKKEKSGEREGEGSALRAEDVVIGMKERQERTFEFRKVFAQKVQKTAKREEQVCYWLPETFTHQIPLRLPRDR